MALINCAECGKEISDKASACPHCGAPIDYEAIERKKFEQKQQAEIEEQAEKEERERLKRVKTEQQQKEAPLGNATSIVVGWGLGSIFVMAALGTIMAGNVLAGFFYFLAAALLLPPIRKNIYAKTNISILPNYRIGLIIGIIVLSGIATSSAESARAEEAKQKIEAEQAVREVAQKEKEQQEFKNNKEKILESVANKIKNKSFKDALQTCNTYMKFGDKDLTPLCTTVKTEVLKIEQTEQEERAKKEAAEAAKAKAREEAELKASMGPRAWKLHKKHPDWSVEDCKLVANNRIWVGMSYDMIKAQRGLPNSANPSNFGSGNRWQWCWHDYTPSCFYDDNDDGIIDSYN